MKRVRCPKCDNYITFDDSRYTAGQSLVFQCPYCGKQFGIRINPKKQDASEANKEKPVGEIVVIENVFHYKQVLPLRMGDNVIGRYMRGNPINCPIETDDPSIDMTHCVINVSRNKKGRLQYVLRDGPSNTGTFVDNEILGDRERRLLSDNSLFTIGATSIILHTEDHKDD